MKRAKSLLNFKKINLSQELGALFALLIMILILSFLSEHFFSFSNAVNILRRASIIGIASVGSTLVIISGGIDLSIGSIISVAGVFLASFIFNMQMSPVIAVLLVLLIGSLLGLINGILIAILKIPAIIATLATLIAYQGIALEYSGGYAIPLIGMFHMPGRGLIGVIPVPVIIMAVVYLLGYILLKYTKLGRIVYGLGGNEEAIHLSGISIKKYRIIIFMLSGMGAALAGMILASRLASGHPLAGEGMELDVIAAPVIGGTNIFGGVGNVEGTIIGVLILAVINNGLTLLDVSPYIQYIVTGAILASAVAINSLKSFQN